MLRTTLMATASVAILALAPTAHAAPAPSSGFANDLFYGDLVFVRNSEASGDSFNAHLANEYRAFSLFEADQMYDWPDAEHFAEKSLTANNGGSVAPEDPAEWDIDASHMAALTSAHADLMDAFSRGAARTAPAEAAHAQAKYDCWVEQQEEGHQLDHIAACRDDFRAAMAALEQAMEPAPQPTAEVQPRPEPEPRPEPQELVLDEAKVYFEWDSAELSQPAERAIDKVAGSIRDRDVAAITVVGHADRSGPASYNQDLSMRRAEAVQTALMRRGLRFVDVDLQAKGESDPAVQTGDGVRERLNRRVVIDLQTPAQESQQFGRLGTE